MVTANALVVVAFATQDSMDVIVLWLSVTAALAPTATVSTALAPAKMAGPARTVKSLNVRMTARGTAFVTTELVSVILDGPVPIVQQRNVLASPVRILAVDMEHVIA
jgi:hypothetical protein